MKKILLVLWISCLSIVSQAQDEKLRIAVLDPTTGGTAMDETKLAVQEIISSTIVATGKYIVIERPMFDKILKEQAFQNSDVADNSQATEIGKLAGAHKVVLSAVSMVGGRNMLSIKMIDVATASIDGKHSKTKICNSNDLLDIVEPLTMEMLGLEANYAKQTIDFTQPQRQTPIETPKPHTKPYIDIEQLSFYIWKQDEVGFLDWKMAHEVCSVKGEGWRLPTTDELQKMSFFINDIKNMNGYNNNFKYWSSESKSKGSAYYYDVRKRDKDNDDKSDADKCVRCVRSK